MEGADLVAAGIAAGRRPQVVFVREERAEELGEAFAVMAGGRGGAVGAGSPAGAGESPPPAVYPVDERVAHRLSTLETPPDALAVFPLPERPPLAWVSISGRKLGQTGRDTFPSPSVRGRRASRIL